KRCVDMYPAIIGDGRGSFLVVSSDGVRDHKGHLLWTLQSESFAQIVPMHISGNGGVTFFAKHIHDRVERYDLRGNVLWTLRIPTSIIGRYPSPAEYPFLFVMVSCEQALQLYDFDGQIKKQISLAEAQMELH